MANKSLAKICFLFALCFSLISCEKNQSIEKEEQFNKIDLSSIVSVLQPSNTMPDVITDNNQISGVNNKNDLTSLIVSNNIEIIGNESFSNCYRLEWIILPRSVSLISAEAFYKCSSLSFVVLENSETLIENDAFLDCFSLTNVYFNGSANKWNECIKNTNNNYLNDLVICFRDKNDLPFSW